jgi:hypothetical protein
MLAALKIMGVVIVVVMAAIQFVRPARTNPPSDPQASFEAVVQPPPAVISSVKRACHDCHSNETVWPWYSNIAPVSWLVASDVNRGRAHLNLSTWTQAGTDGEKPEVGELCEQVKTARMPLPAYKLLHPRAKLSAHEVAALCALTPAERQSAGRSEPGEEQDR